MMSQKPLILWGILIALLLMTAPILAQERRVTDDEVNDVAEHMFCPVCEHEPLDDCRTPTCIQWKEEIRNQLAAGATEQEIFDDFIARYGQHVMAVPTDPFLRGLTLYVPLLVSIIAAIWGIITFMRWQSGQKPKHIPTSAAPTTDNDKSEDVYRAQIERDLLSR